jgi:hypothetical protein
MLNNRNQNDNIKRDAEKGQVKGLTELLDFMVMVINLWIPYKWYMCISTTVITNLAKKSNITMHILRYGTKL